MRAPRQTSVSATLASPGEGALSSVGVRRPDEVPGLWSLWSSALPSSEELYPAKPSAPIPERLSDPPASHRYIDHFGIAWSRLGSNGQQPAEPVTACPAGQLNPGAIAGHFRERPRRDLGARSTARADAAPLATNRPRSETRPGAGIFCECPRQESNLNLPLRRRSSYPLDYEGKAITIGDGSTRRLPALGAKVGRGVVGKALQWLAN